MSDSGLAIRDERFTVRQKLLVGLTALTVVFDGVDNQLLGVSIPTIMAEWAVPRSAFAPVVSLGNLGMMIGGAAAGISGDRVGRRSALLACVAFFGAATVAMAFVGDPGTLAVLRLLAGLGLGGAMPNAATLAAEYSPVRWRPLAVTVTIVCMPLGATVAGMLGSQFLAHAGWRQLFMIGGTVPIAAAALLFRLMPESPEYLARQASRPATVTAPKAPVSTIFESSLRRDTFALWGAFVSCMLAVYLGLSWLPALLTDAGFTAAAASHGITAFNLGGVAGAIGGGLALSRVGSRVAMLTMTAGAIAATATLAVLRIDASSPALALLLVTISGGLINAVQTTMYALATNVYASAIRATGVGIAVAVGRVGAVASGYAGAWVLQRGGGWYFGAMAVAMAVCFVMLAIVRRHVGERVQS